MRRRMKAALAAAVSVMMLAGGIPATGQNGWVMEAEAHGGRTDSHGGHRDNKNASGLGSYHYHCGGHPAHLHTDGICPYASAAAGQTTQAAKQAQAAEQTQAAVMDCGGWHQDHDHWRYAGGDGADLSGCWKQIDSSWYCFDESGCMRTGWHHEDGCSYYLGTDGRMVTGRHTIDGREYVFDENGRLEQ